MATNWTRNAIIFALRERGTSAAALASQAGISRYTIYGAMQTPYPRVHDIIARAIGRPRQDIWPEFYDDSGKRRGLINARRAA